jgi:quercetin dioxygenase-like cupin family protein
MSRPSGSVPPVDRWHLPSIDVTGKREPRVLFSTPECRAIVIDLRAGESMGEHSVRERAVAQVVSGTIAIGSGGTEAECGAGTLVTFEPAERHTVRAVEESRLLLLFSPWPGAGHYQADEDADPERMPAHAQSPPLCD